MKGNLNNKIILTMKKILIYIISSFLLITLITFIITKNLKNDTSLNIPNISNVSSISIENSIINSNYLLNDENKIKDLLTSLQATKIKNIENKKMYNILKRINIKIKTKTNKKYENIYLYKIKDKYYIEQDKIQSEITKEKYLEITNILKKKEDTFNNFYTEDILLNYKKLTDLDDYYNTTNAVKDNCLVITPTQNYNEDLINNFITNYNKDITTFLRIVTTTDEGDINLYDIKYSSSKSVEVLVDNRRDTNSNDKERLISLKEFKYFSLYQNYLILHNEKDLNPNFINNRDILIISSL